jgi:hypothetical protein
MVVELYLQGPKDEQRIGDGEKNEGEATQIHLSEQKKKSNSRKYT